MNRFYVENEQIQENRIQIIGNDVNHIKNVLRLKNGEKVAVCNGQGQEFYCIIDKVCTDYVDLIIEDKKQVDTELKNKIYLFQGLPKKDKMELIIQKAVELGVFEIIPVMTNRTIVKIDNAKKEEKKLQRWQSISTSASKQSGRGIIPEVSNVMSFEEALKKADELDCAIIPYELAEDIEKTRKILGDCVKKGSIGIFIGPEGGFEKDEIELAISHGIEPITLGKRILRTETAGFTIMSILMFLSENN